MGLFGNGALVRRVKDLMAQVEAADTAQGELRRQIEGLKKQLGQKDDEIRQGKDAKRKLEKKLTKSQSNLQTEVQKGKTQSARIDALESDLGEYRSTVLSANRAAEEAQVKLQAYQTKATGSAPKPASKAAPEPKPTQEQPREEKAPRFVDARIERLEKQLESERAFIQEMKTRLAKAEKGERVADKRRIGETNKSEAVLRDLQHSLRSERRAYKILQLQYETLLAHSRGVEPPAAPASAAPEAIAPETAPIEPTAQVVPEGEPVAPLTPLPKTAEATSPATETAEAAEAAPEAPAAETAEAAPEAPAAETAEAAPEAAAETEAEPAPESEAAAPEPAIEAAPEAPVDVPNEAADPVEKAED